MLPLRLDVRHTAVLKCIQLRISEKTHKQMNQYIVKIPMKANKKE